MKADNMAAALVLFITLLTTRHAASEPDITGYYKWTPGNSTRRILYCPERCQSVANEDPEECCSCNAKPCWDLDACGESVAQLYLEYINRHSSVVVVPPMYKNATRYKLSHTNGRLREIPDNICDFVDTLIELDLRNNRLTDISKLKCLRSLDTLRLDSNRITKISNDTFTSMKNLRLLTLSNVSSGTESIDLKPNTFSITEGNILYIDVTSNDFHEVDVTSIVRKGPFCEMDFSGSEIVSQTNILNYNVRNLTFGETHGPGTISFQGASGQTFMNWTTFGLKDYRDFPKYFTNLMKWNNKSVLCDCNIAPFIRDLGVDAFKYWLDIRYSFVCEQPDRMKGRSLTKIILTDVLDDLICKIGPCPVGCTCTDVQNQFKVVVKCTGLSRFPDFLPYGFWGNTDIDLFFEKSNITKIEDRDYLGRIKVLNLQGSPISTIDAVALAKLPYTSIDLSNHKLATLPDSIRKLDPDLFQFGNSPIRCDCKNLWIGEWITYGSLNPKNFSLKCQIGGGNVLMNPADVTADFLNCPRPETEDEIRLPVGIIASVLGLILVLTPVTYCFHYEIFLLRRKVTERKKFPKCAFDLYVSSADELEINNWIHKYLSIPLQEVGYSAFFGVFDIQFGHDRHESAGNAIENSQNYVVVLSSKYGQDDNSLQEFDTMWKHFKASKYRQMMVINYDCLECSEIQDPRLRAFRRLRWDLNFTERETKMFDRLLKKLGPSSVERKRSANDKGRNSRETERSGSTLNFGHRNRITPAQVVNGAT